MSLDRGTVVAVGPWVTTTWVVYENPIAEAALFSQGLPTHAYFCYSLENAQKAHLVQGLY